MRCSFYGWSSVPCSLVLARFSAGCISFPLFWGIFTELLPWPCPLTLLENWLEAKAGVEPYQGGFLLHYLDKFVYPDISATALMVAGLLVCAFNLGLYGRRMWIAHRS